MGLGGGIAKGEVAVPIPTESFAEFVDARRDRAVGLAFRLLGESDRAIAEDVAQNAFLRAYRALGGFRGESSMETWFYRILVREVQRHRRWESIRRLFNRRTLSSLSAALVMVATVAAAQPPGHPSPPDFPGGPPPEMAERGLERRLKTLGLTPEQKEKVREILESSKENREKARSQWQEAFGEMHRLLEQEPPDEDAVMRQAEKMGALALERHKSMLRTLLRVRAELTPEQREKLKEARETFRPHQGERMRRWWRHEHPEGAEGESE